jgi:hypothetical protein
MFQKSILDAYLQHQEIVPRGELEQALAAIVTEVKRLRNRAVDLDVLEDALQRKADKVDVLRYRRSACSD